MDKGGVSYGEDINTHVANDGWELFLAAGVLISEDLGNGDFLNVQVPSQRWERSVLSNVFTNNLHKVIESPLVHRQHPAGCRSAGA